MSISTPITRASAQEPHPANAVWRIIIVNFSNFDHQRLNLVLRQCFGATCKLRWIDAVEDGVSSYEDVRASIDHDLTIYLYGETMVRTGPAVEQMLEASPTTPRLIIANMTPDFAGQHGIDCLPLEQLTPALLWTMTRYLSEKIRADGQVDLNRELTKDLAAAQHDLVIARGDTHDEAERLRRLAEHSLIGIWHQNSDGGTVFINSRAADILQISPTSAPIHNGLEAFIAPEERRRLASAQQAWLNGEVQELECRIIAPKSGQEKTLLLSGTPTAKPNDPTGGLLLSLLDISERKRSAAMIEQLSHHDALTGLPNRTLFLDRLQQAQAQAKRGRKHNALLILDLDNFKDINDTHGHRIGDEILRMAATRLTHCSRNTDTVARLGSDEFAIICTELGHGNLVQCMAERLIEAMTKPFQVDGETIRATASIGIALFPGDADSADQLIKFADMALHQAKTSGRNRCHFFSPAMDEAVRRRKGLEDDLRRAINDEDFTLLYQPQLRLGDEQVYGAEALVRWNHPDRGLVSPADFIPLAESTGLIRELGHWVLRTACAQGRAWADAGHGDLRIAVNLSAVEFMSDNLLSNVRGALAESGLQPEQLELEITESAIMADMEKAIATMQGLREIGVRLALDDFGTGFSSLAYLKRFPVQALKIDRSFVKEILFSAEDAAIATAVISLGQSLKLEVIAEGVEESAQADHLRLAGCDCAQGCYFGRPVPPADILAGTASEN